MQVKNTIKEKLQRGEPCFGIFLLSGNSIIAEACSVLPIDWMMVDMEASPVTKEGVIQVYQALKGTSVAPMVRVSEVNKHLLEFAWDAGSSAVLIPKVDDAETARFIVDTSYYPPEGNRGINPVRASAYFQNITNYLDQINDNILTMVQIESAEAVENVEEIAAVDGLDVLFIGCGDLAASYGQAGQVTGGQMDIAINKVLMACKKYNKVPGIFAYNLELAKQYVEEGFQFIAIGNDIKLLQGNISKAISELHSVWENKTDYQEAVKILTGQ